MKTIQATLEDMIEGADDSVDMQELSDEVVGCLAGGQDRDLSDQGATATPSDPFMNSSTPSYGGYVPMYPRLESGYYTPGYTIDPVLSPMPGYGGSLYSRADSMVKYNKRPGRGRSLKKIKAYKPQKIEDEFGSDAGL